MKKDRLTKKLKGAQSAIDAYAIERQRADNQEQKRRNGRLIKLGVAAEQMFKAGDVNLLARFEAAVVGTDGHKAIASRTIDRDDFALDEPVTWFDEMREEALEHRPGGARELAAAAPPAAEARASTAKKEASAKNAVATPAQTGEGVAPRPATNGGPSAATPTTPSSAGGRAS